MFATSDACATPVLAFGEVLDEPHIAERDTFYDAGTDGLQPRPAPRFSRSQTEHADAAAGARAPTTKRSCGTGSNDWDIVPTNQ